MYNTNQKDTILATSHQVQLPSNDVVEFILGNGENKEQRKLRLENTIKDYFINYSIQIHHLLDKNDKLKDQIIATKDEVIKAQLMVTATEQKVTATEQKVTATEQKVTATEQKVTATEQKVTATEQKVTATEQKVTATEQKISELTEKWKETETELTLANTKLLKLTNNFNVRGAVEFVRAEILGKNGPSGKWKEIWDSTLSALLEDKHFRELLKEYSKTQNVQFKSLENDLQGLYHRLSTYAHSGNKDDIIIDDPFSFGEQIVLVAIFERYNIPYLYKDKNGDLVTNPFKMKNK